MVATKRDSSRANGYIRCSSATQAELELGITKNVILSAE